MFNENNSFDKIIQTIPLDEAKGTILAQEDADFDNVIVCNPNKEHQHFCVLGPSSSGKTISFVLTYCLQAANLGESLIIADCQNTLYRETSMYFRSKGYIVRRFDPSRPQHSDGWNLFHEIGNDINKAKILVECIMANNIRPNYDEEFCAAATHLLTAIAVHTALTGVYKDLNEFTFFGNEEFLDVTFKDINVEDKCYEARKSYIAFKQAAPEVRQYVMAEVASKLQAISHELSPFIGGNATDMEDPAEVSCVYYYEVPPDGRYTALNAAFFSLAFYDMAHYAKTRGYGCCRVPVTFLLDDVCNIGFIPSLDKIIATEKQKRVFVAMTLQSVSQLKQRYPDTWEAILWHCYIKILMGCNDADTAQYISSVAGIEKVATPDGRFAVRSVITPDEILRLPYEKCIILAKDKAIVGEKFYFARHPDAIFIK